MGIMKTQPTKAPFRHFFCLTFALCWSQLTPFSGQAQDKVFSGPQPGETTTAFDTIALRGDHQGETIDPIASNNGAATLLIFTHGIERSMAPLMRVMDTFGAKYPDRLKTDWIFLSDDPITSRQRLPQVARSLRLKGRLLLSSDGIEGPGNYGLNKECLLTVLAAKDNKVTANFALIQPGIADAERIIASLSELIGLEEPPSIESLTADMRMAMNAGRRGNEGRGRMQRRGQQMKRDGQPGTKGKLPGAAPTDQQLVSYLRQFIQKTNSDERVDQVLAKVREYVQGDKDLTSQAVNGWIRVLHVQYGTEYAQKQGAAFVAELKKTIQTP